MLVLKFRINNSEERLCNFIAAVVFCLFLTNLSDGLSMIVPISSSAIKKLIKVFIGIIFIPCIRVIIQRINRYMIFFSFGALLVTLLNTFFFPELDKYFYNTAVSFFTCCLTTSLTCSAITDFDLLKQKLLYVSYFVIGIIFFLLVGVFFLGKTAFISGEYSMGLGYACALPTLMLSVDAIDRKKIWAILGVMVAVACIISFGSRGPLLEIILFLAYYLLRKSILTQKLWKGILIVLLIAVLLLNYRYFLNALSLFLEGRGFHSRVIRTLSSEKLYLSGRDIKYETLLSCIKDEPFAIRGINAEWAVFDVYAHNIVLELCYQLGIVIGGMCLLIVLGRVVKTLTIKTNDAFSLMCIVFVFASIPQLMFSSSIWTHYIFWMWITISRRINPYMKENFDFVESNGGGPLYKGE